MSASAKGERLDRVLAQHRLGTRSEVTKFIRQGRVKVDEVLLTDPSIRIGSAARVTVDDFLLEAPPVLVGWHKPMGVICTVDDPWGRKDLGTEVTEWLRRGLHPVGRLDADTSGLLLFSASGDLTQRLLHPKRRIEKQYRATLEGPLTPKAGLALTRQLEAGVETSLGVFRASGVKVNIEPPTVELVVTEGKNRMVRRMLANSGHPAASLVRLRFGNIMLGDLEEGECRPIPDDELAQLQGLTHRAHEED